MQRIPFDGIARKYRVDPERIYITGLSMGGFGTWNTIMDYPDLFAAAAPLCGGGDESMVARIKEVPVWNFHGARDQIVPIRESEDVVEALRQVGGRVRFTVYPNGDLPARRAITEHSSESSFHCESFVRV